MRRFYIDREPQNQRRVCPHCHIYLPDHVASGQVAGEVFAIVGARNAGKSNYFGVLLDELKKKHGPGVGFDMLDAPTYTPSRHACSSTELYRERYGRFLYDAQSPRAVSQTQSVLATQGKDLDPRIPLIYLLQFAPRPWHKLTRPWSHRIPVYLMIFDMAGEDTGDQTVMEQYCRFIERATGLIFLIDPFEYPGIRKNLPPSLAGRLKPTDADPSIVVDRVISLLHKRRRLGADRQIKTPAAFVLTKSDMLDQIPGMLDMHSPIPRETVHRQGFDRAGCETLSREIEQRIADWESAELVHKARSNFRAHSFFAVSALGELPAAGTMQLAGAPKPKRVADPLLWLFWKRGYIPAVPEV